MKVEAKRLVLATLTERGWTGAECGWVLLGRLTGSGLLICCSIPLSGERGSKHVSFDKRRCEAELLPMLRTDPSLHICGTAHTHPPGCPEPSVWDLAEFERWTQRLRHRVGAFCVACDGRLRWFLATGTEEVKSVEVETA